MLISQQKIIRRILRYTFFVWFILWILVSIYIWYQYIRFSSQQITTKWGTFVEWIFETTSFLPYLQNNFSSNFYQGLLFNSCSKQIFSWENRTIEQDLCKIYTPDNQSYEIILSKWMIRSDWTPVSIEDIFFTYDEILHQNIRNIKSLDTYKNIEIEKNWNRIKIKFPTVSPDNEIFFTNYILPKHKLEESTLQEYISNFSLEPIYTNCANIVSQSTDQYSLIFNLINCKDTNLNFYQIKNINSFDQFKTDILDGKWSMVDVYIDKETLPWYVSKDILTNKLVTLFFNTNSDKLYVRTRRALWWFIRSNFYTTWYENHISKYNEPLFNQFLTNWDNIEDFLKRWYGENLLSKEDLIDAWVTVIPTELTLKWEQPKHAFYTETLTWTDYLEITLDKEYSSAYVDYNGKAYYDPSYSTKTHKIKYPIWLKLKNFGTWLNKYKLYGFEKGKKLFLWSIDVYNMVNLNSIEWDAPINPIKILYYNTPTYEYIAENLRSTLSSKGLLKYFSFNKVDSAEELQGKILIWDYDIIINSIDMWIKKDITNLFATDNVQVDPSQYKNQSLAWYIKSYINSTSDSTKSKLATQINSTFATDMPLLFLGKIIVPINIKENMVNRMFWTWWINSELYEYNWRSTIYNKIHLADSISIDQKRVWNYNNFSIFVSQMFNK